jgi:hypothetical protein
MTVEEGTKGANGRVGFLDAGLMSGIGDDLDA